MAIDTTSTQKVTAPPAPVAGSAALTVKSATAVDINGMLVSDENAATGPTEELSFWDVLDIVNPLQHVPLVNQAYRALTGDEIKPSTQVIGDFMFGGVAGGLASIANAVLQQATGKDAAGHMLAAVGIGSSDTAPVALAKSDAAASPNAPQTLAAAPAAATPAVSGSPPAAPGARPPAAGSAPPNGSRPGAPPANTAAADTGAKTPPKTQPITAEAVSAAFSKANPQRQPQTPIDPAALAAAGYHPSKMPARDMMLRTTMPPEAAAAKHYTDSSRLPLSQQPAGQQAAGQQANSQSASGGRMTASAAPPTAASSSPTQPMGQPTSRTTSQAGFQSPQSSRATASAAPPAGATATPPAAPPNDGMPPQAVARDAIADTMMRNLSKYRNTNTLTQPSASGTNINTAS